MLFLVTQNTISQFLLRLENKSFHIASLFFKIFRSGRFEFRKIFIDFFYFLNCEFKIEREFDVVRLALLAEGHDGAELAFDFLFLLFQILQHIDLVHVSFKLNRWLIEHFRRIVEFFFKKLCLSLHRLRHIVPYRLGDDPWDVGQVLLDCSCLKQDRSTTLLLSRRQRIYDFMELVHL